MCCPYSDSHPWQLLMRTRLVGEEEVVVEAAVVMEVQL